MTRRAEALSEAKWARLQRKRPSHERAISQHCDYSPRLVSEEPPLYQTNLRTQNLSMGYFP